MKNVFFILVLAIGLAAMPAITTAKPAPIPVPQEKPELPEAAPPPTPAPDTMPNDVASTSYFPVLPYDAPPDVLPKLVPIASNHSIDGSHPGVTNAIIVVHDFTRDAQDMLSILSGLAGPNNGTTIILAPQFLLDFDIARLTQRLPDEGRLFARWPLGGWENGGDSIAQSPEKPISAFTVIDLMLVYLGDKNYFPDMKQVVVAGHGTGGDFVQRYAAVGRAMDILKPQGLSVRFLVADASSYLYLTGVRQKGRKSDFATPSAATCPTYNDYAYGLDKLNDYARRVGPSAIKLSYAARDVTYLTGEKAAISDPLPDPGCAAMLEGPDRVSRGAIYNLYLHQIFGDTLGPQQFITIPKAAYDAAALFSSPCGMAVLFGDGNCATPSISGARTLR